MHLLVELAKGISNGKLRGAYMYPDLSSSKRVALTGKLICYVIISMFDSIPDTGQDE